jgi:type III secretion protein K
VSNVLARLLARPAALLPGAAEAVPAQAGGAPPVERGPLDLMRLVMHYNLVQQAGLHPSWLPASWPARYRRMAQYGPAGQAVLGELVRRQNMHAGDYQFDSRLKRLALFDAGSLRRLAVYAGLGAHLPLLKQRGPAAAQLRRQARRYDAEAVPFALERMPLLPELRMDARPLQERPLAAGRLLVSRGYRLLLAAVAPEGETVVRRVRLKFPRRLATLGVPPLQPRQAQQLSELMLLCIVPERLPQWDWLF